MLKSSKSGAEWQPIKQPTPELAQAQDGIKEASNIVTEPLRTTVMDLQRVSKQHLLQYVTGSSWSVTFYHFLRGKNDPLKIIDPKVDNSTQQLEKIHNLELRVTTALQRSQQSDNRTFEITGAATVVNSIPPNVTDCFVAEMDGGRLGLFNITSSIRGSDNKIATYEIEYAMLYEVTPDIANILKACTVREYYYVRERAWWGEDTLLQPDEWNEFLRVERLLLDVEQTYVKRFYDHETQTLKFPEDEYRVYDVFLARFVRAIGLTMPGHDIRIYPHPPKQVNDVETFWDAIINQSGTFLEDYNRRCACFSVKTFRVLQMMNTIGWSKFHATLFFTADNKYATYPYNFPGFAGFVPESINYRGNVGETLPAFGVPTLTPYILSEEFYKGSYTNVLEWALHLFIKQQPISPQPIIILAEMLRTLPKTAQFYYTPLVYVLLRYVR